MNSHLGLSMMGRRMTAPPISWLMSLTLARPQLISLAAGFTDNESLPVERTRQLFENLLSAAKTGRSALQYGTTAGDPELRRMTARRLQRLDGDKSTGPIAAAYDPERMLITNGSQQLLYLVTECLCDPGDIVLLEDPTYFVFLGIAQSRDLRCHGVRMTPEGMDLESLEKTLESLKKSGDLRRVKMLYSISYFQNPTGISTSLNRKREVLELLRRYEPAAKHPIYLLEDAAYRELDFNTDNAIPSALSLPRFAGHVIYTGTYSKPYATGARVGFGVLPEPVYTAALRAKGNHDFGTANLLQSLISNAMRGSDYTEHLTVLRARYQRKARVMANAMRRHFPPTVQWAQPAGGLYFWVKLPPSVPTGSESKLFRAALARDVVYVPGELCYATNSVRRKPNCEMRVSFGGATEAHIRTGIERLGQVFKEMIPGK